jgi:hypothetical protein
VVVEVEECVVWCWPSGVLEYWSTYSVLLRFGGDGTLISGKAGVPNNFSEQAALLLARQHERKEACLRVAGARKGEGMAGIVKECTRI